MVSKKHLHSWPPIIKKKKKSALNLTLKTKIQTGISSLWIKLPTDPANICISAKGLEFTYVMLEEYMDAERALAAPVWHPESSVKNIAQGFKTCKARGIMTHATTLLRRQLRFQL